MSRAKAALISAAGALFATLAIIAAITAVTGGSLTEVLAQPSIWLVEGATIALTALAVLTRPEDDHNGPAPERPSTRRAIATAMGWAAIAAVLIGVLLALTIDTPIGSLLTSLKFLIPAAIAVFVAALEAWPNQR